MALHFLSQNGVLLLLQKIKLALSSKVDKVDGKGLSTNDFTDTLHDKLENLTVPTNNAQLVNGAGYQTADQVNAIVDGKGYQTADQVNTIIEHKGYQTQNQVESFVQSKGYQTADQVQESINNSSHLKRQVVDTLPSSDQADEHTLYILKTVDGESVYYEEYQLIDGKIERVGYSKVDLTGYWDDTDLTEMQSNDINSVCNTVFGVQ